MTNTLANFDSLKGLLESSDPQRLAVVCAHDEYVIDAIEQALNFAIIPILIGKKKLIQKLLEQKRIDINKYLLINADTDEEAAQIGVKLVKDNQADLLMKGLIDTKVLLKAVVNSETGIKEKRLLSHVMMASSPNYHKVLFATDCAMVISPTLEDKQEIINNALDLTRTLGYNNPKVGIVSAVEKVNPKIPSTVDAEKLVELKAAGKIGNCLLGGPFAIDNLVSKEAAAHKGITSPIAGDVDILIFPNIEAANTFYKTIVFLGKAKVCGIVVGAKCPIILTSRADDAQAKLNSIILGAVYAYGKNINN